MKKFKVEVSKNHKKYNLVFHAENELKAKERAHKEGYSILNVVEIGEEHITGNKFIFGGIKNGEVNNGKVIGNDIFKAYLKLVDSFNYEISYIYPEKEVNISNEEKIAILKQLKEQYNIYKRNKYKEQSKADKKSSEKKEEHFYLKKELEETYKLIQFILEKMQSLIDGGEDIGISLDQKEKLKNIYNDIVKLKKTTNLFKLKQIGEIALVKIGTLELKKLEENKEESTRKLLKDTNSLLKQIGSKKSFIEKSKDIKYIFSNFFNKISKSLQTKEIKEKKKEGLDKETYSYLKTTLLISRYKKRLKENTLNIIKNIVVFIIPFGINKEIKQNILLKRLVIKQNIFILKNKISGKGFSYTRIKRGIKKIYEDINLLFLFSRKVSFKISFLYSIIFIFYINISYYFGYLTQVNYKGIFIFILLLLVYIVTFLSRGFISIVLSFVFLFFIIIFGVVNF